MREAARDARSDWLRFLIKTFFWLFAAAVVDLIVVAFVFFILIVI
jgi:hypothetical protein